MKKYILIIGIILTTALFSQDLSGIKICIDPGHSGHESDDRGLSNGFWESESNLTKGLHVKALLEDLGATVFITRTGNDNDYPDDKSLSARAGVANSNNVDFFLSIHSNAFNGKTNYAMAIFNGKTNAPRRQLAKDMANILSQKIHTANRTTSAVSIGDLTLNPTWTMGYGVLYPATMPANISEGSFHDYWPESYRLLNIDYRKKEAWAIVQSFIQYFDKTPYGIRHIAGLVRDNYESVGYYSITSADGKQPIDNITATLTPGNIVYNGDGNNNGFYFFDSLATGTYQVKVEANGYHSDSATVVVGSSFFKFRDFYLVSNRPPYLLSNYPANGDSSVPAWDPIVLTFNKPIDTTSVQSSIAISPSVPLKFSWKNDNKSVNITSDSLDFVATYTLTISDSLKDRWGYYFDADGNGTSGGEVTITFTTGKEDMTAPSLSSLYPKSSASKVSLNPILKFIFSEELDSTTVTADKFRLEKYSNHASVPFNITHNVVNDKSIVHLFPTEELKYGEIYKRLVYKGMQDYFSNPMPSNLQFTFATGSNRDEVTMIDNFESGLTSNWYSPSSSGSSIGLLTNSEIRENTNYLNLLSGSQKGMELEYGFDTTKTEWLLREYLSGGTPKSVTFDDSCTMQVYIFGDGSRNKFRFCVDDNGTGGHEVSPWYEIDWIGWELVSWDFSSTGTWIGDGSLDGTLKFDSFQLTYNSDASSENIGKIYFDDLRVVKSVYADIKENEKIPTEYTLYQNYPNPFNPNTTINYYLPKSANAKVNIYDMTGKKITTLINEHQNQGFHSIQFNGSNYASGIYYYQLLTKEFSQVKKMVLIK